MMMTSEVSVTIRQASGEDAGAVSELLRDVFSETYGHVLDAEVLQEHLDKYLSEQAIRDDMTSSSYFAAKDGERLLGVLKVVLDEEQRAEIAKLYVGGWARANNVGSNLMDTAINYSQENAASHIWLNVWKDNQKAIYFYEKHGFNKVGTTNVYVGETVFDDFVMEKAL